MKSLNDYIKWIHTDDVNLAFEDFIKDNVRNRRFIFDEDIETYILENQPNTSDELLFESILRSYSMEKFVDALKRRFNFHIINFAWGSERNEEGNKYYIDTVEINKQILLNIGLKKENIIIMMLQFM